MSAIERDGNGFLDTAKMSVRERFTEALKTSMKAGTAPRTSTLRMILAKLKDVDIAARPKGVAAVSDDEVTAMLRGMVKSRRESVDLYERGGRPELAARETAEIGVIEEFLPRAMDDAAIATAVDQAVAETGAVSPKEMGKVMAALKSAHGAVLDMSRVGPVVKARLGG